MVDINTAANVADIVSGVAILVSLIYVGYQVRQSNRIASASALQSVLDRYSDRTITQYMDHPEMAQMMVRGHHRLGDLNVNEKQVFTAWILREIFHMQNVMQLYTNGLLDRVDYETWLAFTAAQLKTSGGQESWNRQKISLTPTIVKIIDGYLESHRDAPSLVELYPEVYGADR